LFYFYFFVHFFDEEVEGLFVDVFSEGISDREGFLISERGVDDIKSHFSGFELKGVF
jgi:hypothetical protein